MKKSFRTWISEKIARTMLFIKATTYKKLTEEPYKWASGMLMRIYNDNRMMLGNYMHRLRITRGFAYLINERGIEPDYIIGTTSSGIAPAASLAHFLKKNLLINHEDIFFVFDTELATESLTQDGDFDIVISTSPFAIPYGVQYANIHKKSFAYIRPQKKEHGKGQSVEGIIKSGMRFALVYNGKTTEEVEEIVISLKNEFSIELVTSMEVDDGHSPQFPDELSGKTAVVIEDLFSTGGSSAAEVYDARENGMICNHCFSIFSYGFDCLKRQFSGEDVISKKDVKLSTPCETDSLLMFPTLLMVIEKLKFYPDKVIEAMREEIEGFDERYKKFLADKTEKKPA